MIRILTPISHRISGQIAPLLPQIAPQQGGDSVHATRPHPAGGQNVVTGCASCQRSGEKWGLILDTSTERGIVALAQGCDLLFFKELPVGLKSSHFLMTSLQEIFQKYPMDLQAIGVTVGPGSFTGIRVAVAAAKGLALARSLPLIALSSLAGFISPHEGRFASVIDARAGGAYVLIQERVGDEIRELGPPELCPKEALLEKFRECRSVVGPSFQKLPIEGAVEVYPDAAHLAKIAAQRYADGDFSAEGRLDLVYLNNG